MEYEVDGIMIGRAAIGNPWIFREISHYFKTGEHLDGPTLNERVEACRTHLMKSIEWKGERTGILEMRSEERRVGKECVSKCRSRCGQYNKKKKITKQRKQN